MSIWPPYEAFYIESMLFNSSSAVASVEYVADVFAEIRAGALSRDDVDDDALLNHLQNVVLQGAALSRYLWPVRPAYADRGAHLRAALGVTDASPLRRRDLRNGLEHFDERLDAYLQRLVVGHVLPSYVGPTADAAGVPLHVFRAYYVDRGVFSLLGEEHEVQPLADEIGRVHNLLATCAEAGGRLPPIAPASGISTG